MSAIYRIIVATDAMDMGVNNPDIKRVIQWGVPQGRVPSLHQRGDQAAQSKLVQRGYLIWFIPKRKIAGDTMKQLLEKTQELDKA